MGMQRNIMNIYIDVGSIIGYIHIIYIYGNFVVIFMVHARVYAEKMDLRRTTFDNRHNNWKFRKLEANGKPRLIYTQPLPLGELGS